MRRSVIGVSLAIACVMSSSTAPVGAQKKGKPPADQPVWVEFLEFTDGGPTRIKGDGLTLPGSSEPAPYSGIINAVGELVLNLNAGSGRHVVLDFTDAQAEPGPCSPACTFSYNTPLNVGDDEHFGMATNVVDEWGTPTEGGFAAVQTGTASWARFDPTFDDPRPPDGLGRDLYFVLRYYPGAYEGSDFVLVTRQDDKTWYVETAVVDPSCLADCDRQDFARLWRHGGRTASGKPLSTSPNEGLFRMPFRIKVTRP